MSIPFTPWPEEFTRRYREKGYWLGQPLTHILRRQCEDRPDAVAVICGGRRLSYADLDAWSGHLAANLARRGLRGGDTALVQLPNVAEFYAVFFALLKMGVAPINALFSHNRLELAAYAEQIRPRLLIAAAGHPLFADGAFADGLQADLPGLDTVLVLGRTAWAEELGRLFEAADGAAPDVHPSATGEVAFFQLSGGSTGTPKLIPRTHDDYYYSVRRSVEICGLDTRTRYLCALPAAHNFPLSSPGALGVFHAGGTVVMAPDPSPATCFELIRRHRVDMTGIVPPVASLWLDAARDDAAPLSSLRVVQVGGASLSEAVARRIPPTLGCSLQQVFGMAEGLVNYTRPGDGDERAFTTQGRPMSPDDEIKVVDPDGRPVAAGETGELLARGPYTFRGYYRSPEYNARAFDAEGFYRSGDLVRLTADGDLQVVGRKKDQINRGGEKFAAEEVENLLLRHEAVAEVALVSMPDPVMGEKSCAYIVTRDATLRPVALRKYLRGLGVADFKLPDRIEMVRHLPVTAVGKIDKQTLRKRAGH
jgi:2,3-dihydroxybenzoate-AMP ligase